ncbi:Tannase and feruloyl esterase [Mannheimia haemolytica]|uniref:Tannase and feruloyl esterase n=1 Tax=Mannheimia haemolytica TaxID=75985 RepID=A0A378MVM8_MANHA|nr:Tannase and feruloyl esterase [Mannheimia haemolytica]
MAAMRYPQEFDGVIAGSPGFRVSRSVLAEVWDNRALLAVAPKNGDGDKILSQALTQQDLDVIANGVLTRCDKLDGLADGLINAWEQCDFQPEMVAKQLGQKKSRFNQNDFRGGEKQSRRADL